MRLPEPLDYDYVDELLDELSFYEYDDYDDDYDITRTITAATGPLRTPDAGYVRLMFEVNDDSYGFPKGDGFVETQPTIWWQANEREEFDSYPYEFGQIPLVADRLST